MTQSTGRRQRRPQVQDVSAAQDPDALLTIETVSKLTGLAPATIRKRAQRGRFPHPLRLSSRMSRWRAAEVRLYLQLIGQGLQWQGGAEAPPAAGAAPG